MPARTVTYGNNTYTVTQAAVMAMGMIFKNKLAMSKSDNTFRGVKKNFNGEDGWHGKIGNTVQMRNPQRFIGYSGRKYKAEPRETFTYTLVIDNQEGQGVDETAWEEKFLNMRERAWTMAPMINELTSRIDLSACVGRVSDSSRAATAEGSTTWIDSDDAGISDQSDGAAAFQHAFGEAGKRLGEKDDEQRALNVFSEAGARLQAMGADGMDPIRAYIPNYMSRDAAISMSGFYNPRKVIEKYFRSTRVEGGKPEMGIDSYQATENLEMHVCGNLGGTSGATNLRVTSTPAEGSEIVKLTATVSAGMVNRAGFLKKGDVLRFGYGSDDTPIQLVNWLTRKAVPDAPMDYVVTGDVTPTGSGTSRAMDVKVYPPFESGSSSSDRGAGSKRRQTVSRRPAANAAVYVNGVRMNSAANRNSIAGRTLQTGYVMVPKQIAMCFVKYKLPHNEEGAYEVSVPNSFYAQVIKWTDSEVRENKCRVDCMWGVKNRRPERGGRIFATAS